MKKLIFVMITIGVFVSSAYAQVHKGPVAVFQQNPTVGDDGRTFLYPNDHPDRLQYDDDSQYMCVDEQGHWVFPLANPLAQAMGFFTNNAHPSHIHIVICGPLYGIMTPGMTIQFTGMIMAREFDGQVGGLYINWFKDDYYAHDIVWDDTGSSTPPIMIGIPSPTPSNPQALKMWHFTFQIEIDTKSPAMQNGFYPVTTEVTANFNLKKGQVLPDQLELVNRFPIFALANPSAPLALSSPEINVENRVFAFDGSGNALHDLGGNFSTTDQFIPTKPINRVWNIDFKTADYGGKRPTINEVVECSGADFHNNIDCDGPRRLQDIIHDDSQIGQNFNMLTMHLDPSQMCGTQTTGTVTKARLGARLKVDVPGVTESTSLIKFNVTANCTNINNPPPPSWHTIGVIATQDVQQFLNDDLTAVIPKQYRICQAGDVNCSSAIIEP